jgi:hypothetical protein
MMDKFLDDVRDDRAFCVILKRQLFADIFSPEGVPKGDLYVYHMTIFDK